MEAPHQIIIPKIYLQSKDFVPHRILKTSFTIIIKGGTRDLFFDPKFFNWDILFLKKIFDTALEIRGIA